MSPVYPINLSKNCVISLFMKRQNDIDKFCTILVEPNSNLPMANYISSGSWLVTTKDPLDFAIACHGSKYKMTMNKRINPPISILTINETCTATNDNMTLLPFYNRQSSYDLKDDSFVDIINNYHLTSRKLWRTFHQSLPKFNLTKLPKELSNIKEIPMDEFISQLKSLGQVTEDSPIPNWVYVLIYAVIALLVGIIIFIVCKYKGRLRLRLPCSAKREGSERVKNFAAKYDRVAQLVSVKTEGDVTTNRDVASAPMLASQKDDPPNNMYPVLKFPVTEQ